jgi:hypothetical protein
MRASKGFSVTYPSSMEFSKAMLNMKRAMASLFRIRLVAVSEEIRIISGLVQDKSALLLQIVEDEGE